MVINCKTCSKEFKIPPSVVKLGKGKFCSKPCYAESLKVIKIPRICEACGIEYYRQQSQIYWKQPRFCSKTCSNGYKGKFPRTEEWKKKLSLATIAQNIKGINHPRWIEDRTKVVISEKKHLDSNYKEWMRQVKNRDDWKCRIFNQDCSGRLEAHHILSWAEFPELRYQVNNGISLCHSHHPRGREKEKRLAPIFQELVSVSKQINWQSVQKELKIMFR